MKTLELSSKYNNNQYQGKITEELDNIKNKEVISKTYIYIHPSHGGLFYIRCFGATRGYIEVDCNFKITSIHINESDKCFYDKEALGRIINKYLNCKIITGERG